jgi:hypothetical protein
VKTQKKTKPNRSTRATAKQQLRLYGKQSRLKNTWLKKEGGKMRRFLATIMAIVLLLEGSYIMTVAVAASPRSGTASITWERGSGGSITSGSRRPLVRDDGARPILTPAPARKTVSVPSPQMSLGRLPETGANDFIPFLLLTVGTLFLLAYTICEKKKQAAIKPTLCPPSLHTHTPIKLFQGGRKP